MTDKHVSEGRLPTRLLRPQGSRACLLVFLGCFLNSQIERFSEARAQEPDAFVASIPGVDTDISQQVDVLIRDLDSTKDSVQRVTMLQRLFSCEHVLASRADSLRSQVEKTLRDLPPDSAVNLAVAVAPYPSLHQALIAKAALNKQREWIRLQLVRNLTDYETAKRLSAAIRSADLRHYSLEVLARLAPSLDQKLDHLSALYSSALYSPPIYVVRPYAVESSVKIRDFVLAHVPLEERPGVLVNLSLIAAETNEAAAQLYIDAAWREVASNPEPWKPASFLLRSDVTKTDQETWLRRFDQFVLPALRDTKCGIDLLSELIRFDIELMLNRTKQSSVHPARPYEKILPSVARNAFRLRPDVVLAWLDADTDNQELRDKCLFEIAEHLSLSDSLSDPEHRLHLARLCETALTIRSSALRLDTIASLAVELPKLGFEVPTEFVHAGRELIEQYYFRPWLELNQLTVLNRYILYDDKRRRALLTDFIEELRESDQNSFHRRFQKVFALLQLEKPGALQRLTFYKSLLRVAQEREMVRIQFEIARAAVSIDAEWAIRTLWSLLPADRGKSGKPEGNIDWTPNPSDASEATRWLERGLASPVDGSVVAQLDFARALNDMVPDVPESDHDAIRSTVSRHLLLLGHFEQSMSVLELIQDPIQRVDARIRWIEAKR